jgi:hypothetical protein
MKMAAFWDVVTCSLVAITMMMETVSSSETSVSIYQTSQCNMPEDSYLHSRLCENRKSHNICHVFTKNAQNFLIEGSRLNCSHFRIQANWMEMI